MVTTDDRTQERSVFITEEDRDESVAEFQHIQTGLNQREAEEEGRREEGKEGVRMSLDSSGEKEDTGEGEK